MHQGADGSLSEDHINILSAGSLDVQGPAGPWGLGAGWECGVLGPWEGAGAAPRPPGPCSPRLQSPPGPRRCTRPPGHPATSYHISCPASLPPTRPTAPSRDHQAPPLLQASSVARASWQHCCLVTGIHLTSLSGFIHANPCLLTDLPVSNET